MNCKYYSNNSCSIINTKFNTKITICNGVGLCPCIQCLKEQKEGFDESNLTPVLIILFESIDKKKFPSVITQAINFGQAILKYKLAGSPNVSEQVFDQRLNICNSCDRLEPESRRCYECGCPVEEKALWATEDCPIGKWQEVRGDSETITTQQDMGKQGCGCG